MDKRVWILGAGFSRPLGGPLLYELMRPEIRNHLEASYPRKHFQRLDRGIYDAVLKLYGYGSLFHEGTFPEFRGLSGERIWADAEQFLDYLDTAVAGGRDSPAFQRLNRIMDAHIGTGTHTPSMQPGVQGALQLSRAAKRLVAAYCSAFLVGADSTTERWAPFVNWARHLTPKDTIITFNYDCVPEVLNRVTKTINVARLKDEHVSRTGGARLLKLHGSVNWKVTGLQHNAEGLPTGKEEVDVEPQEDLDFALKCEDHELAIASPGPLKKAIAAGWLFPLWRQAEEAIREADAITFIGYRFPESDSYALERLMTSVSSNRSRYLAVHTVLGANSPDTPRLTHLLRFALADRIPHAIGQQPDPNPSKNSRTLLIHPLFGQDFLTIYPDSWITDAWRAPIPSL